MDRIMGGKERHILLILTWKCQNSCPYCWEVLMGRDKCMPPFDKEERKWYEWLDLFNDMPPSIIDLSGGEPLTYQGFKKLVELLPPRHALALSTNLGGTIGFQDLLTITPRRFVSVTCSYHKFGSTNHGTFMLRTEKLKDLGYKAHVNILSHHSYDLKGEDRHIIQEFEERGIRYNVSPFENPTLISETQRRLICNAGVNTFTFTPSGDVYRCLTWFRSENREQGRMGNLFNGTFKPYEKKETCNLSCEIFNILNREHSQPNMFSTYVRESS